MNQCKALKNNDYHHPFGMMMPGRSEDAGDQYRYGFNGMEKDDEVNGDGNSYDFGARLYNPRVGRWLSRDPLEKKYPGLNPYNFVGNNPLISIDPDGKDIIVVVEAHSHKHSSGHMLIYVTNYEEVSIDVVENGQTVTKTYYVQSKTTPYIGAYNMGGLAPATQVTLNNPGQVERALKNTVVSYTLDKDEGILGSEFSDDIKKLNPNLDPNQLYFLPEEIQKENAAVEEIKNQRKNGGAYVHDIVDGEPVINDCSTLIVDILKSTGLVSDADFGLTTSSSTDGSITITTPTPNQIGIDLEEMSRNGSSVEKKVNNEYYYEKMTEQNAKAFMTAFIDSYIEAGGWGPNIEDEEYEYIPEDE